MSGMKYRRPAFLFLPLLLAACGSAPEHAAPILPAAPSVTRAEVRQIADAYTQMQWNGRRSLARHGNDPDGLRVDTPDKGVRRKMGYRFWWTCGSNQGMPYKWGGFDTPQQFLQRLHTDATVYAGDYASPGKIQGGDDAVSRYAAGIDCSGFVSRCWRLERPYSTRELGALCRPLGSVAELEPGDIMLLPGVHVWLFMGWKDAARSHMLIAEAGGVPVWNCAYKYVDTQHFLDEGYRPYRYRNIKD